MVEGDNERATCTKRARMLHMGHGVHGRCTACMRNKWRFYTMVPYIVYSTIVCVKPELNILPGLLDRRVAWSEACSNGWPGVSRHN
jgi:hypothetical protein